jgi:hypothetical protein
VSAAYGLRYEARSALMQRGRLYLAYSWLKVPERTLGRRTQIVIEGPRRSGNTFAVTAFELAQPDPVVVAHHRHASVHVVGGVRRELPAVVLVREPEDAVVSYVLYERGRVTMRQALRAYTRFYEDVLPYLDGVVVATFESVTSDLGAVVRAVNGRFGTDFAVFEHSAENVERCFARIEDEHRRRFGRVREERIARPSAQRVASAAALRERFRSEPPALRERAAELHALFSSLDESIAVV